MKPPTAASVHLAETIRQKVDADSDRDCGAGTQFSYDSEGIARLIDDAGLREAVIKLSDGLDLCLRARAIESMESPKTTLTRSGTIPLWMEDQYQKDLAAWEESTRALLAKLTQP